MDDQTPPPRHSYSSLLSLPMLCAGLAIIAACVLAPQMEANRKLTVERDKLKADLAYVRRQAAVDDSFLRHVGGDADLAQRLAQRQMKVIRAGTSVLPLPQQRHRPAMSPFLLVSVPQPPAVAPYHPPAGLLGRLCRSAHDQLYLCGIGMMMVAASLVLGASGDTMPD